VNTAELKVLDGLVYKAVGHCIYCGATEDLGKEHILPFGLSGSAILPKSSCRSCASVTGSLEQDILRGSFWPVRVFRDLKSRSKHKDAPKHVPVSVVRNGERDVVLLNIDEAPILLPFPLFAPPRHLSQAEPTPGISVSGFVTIRFGVDPETSGRTLDASEINITAEQKPCAFARMIAKIGYAFAYAEGAIADLEGEPYVLPAILGKRDEIGRWVGTLTKPLEAVPRLLHRVLIHYDSEKSLLFAEVQLFSDSQTPCYGVVLGKLKPAKVA
ncbi:MAG: hypothetical protein ACREXR_21710, partial [Gammaproteobacteria bacterium]